ncbi:MAG: hypothetical protein RLZZ175_3425 [Bacteroidota bacterium]|jgi:hypothetical protein
MKKHLLILATLFITYNASAQVGFGTTSPSNDIDVESSSATATAVDINCTGAGDPKINFQLSGTSTFSMGIDNSDADKFKIGTSALETGTRLTINSSGQVGINTSSPTATLDVDGSVIFNKSKQRNTFTVMSELSDYMLVVENTWNRVGINKQTPGYTLDVNGQPGANGYTAFTNYSDRRLKTNITNLDTGALSKIMQLRPVSFQYNQKYLQLYPNSDLQKVHKGFIAQEIRTVFPEMVSEMKASPDSVQYLDLDVSHLQVYLLKAMQEQQAIINAQKAEIDALKQNALKVAALENKMNAMLLLLNKKEEVTAKQ